MVLVMMILVTDILLIFGHFFLWNEHTHKICPLSSQPNQLMVAKVHILAQDVYIYSVPMWHEVEFLLLFFSHSSPLNLHFILDCSPYCSNSSPFFDCILFDQSLIDLKEVMSEYVCVCVCTMQCNGCQTVSHESAFYENAHILCTLAIYCTIYKIHLQICITFRVFGAQMKDMNKCNS